MYDIDFKGTVDMIWIMHMLGILNMYLFQDSAMYVCIVMDHYKHGDLDRVLKQKRQKKDAIEELVIKKWLGQIIEALVFVHRKQVIHR